MPNNDFSSCQSCCWGPYTITNTEELKRPVSLEWYTLGLEVFIAHFSSTTFIVILEEKSVDDCRFKLTVFDDSAPNFIGEFKNQEAAREAALEICKLLY